MTKRLNKQKNIILKIALLTWLHRNNAYLMFKLLKYLVPYLKLD